MSGREPPTDLLCISGAKVKHLFGLETARVKAVGAAKRQADVGASLILARSTIRKIIKMQTC